MKSLAEWMTKLSKKYGKYSMAVINTQSRVFMGLMNAEEQKARNRRSSSFYKDTSSEKSE